MKEQVMGKMEMNLSSVKSSIILWWTRLCSSTCLVWASLRRTVSNQATKQQCSGFTSPWRLSWLKLSSLTPWSRFWAILTAASWLKSRKLHSSSALKFTLITSTWFHLRNRCGTLSSFTSSNPLKTTVMSRRKSSKKSKKSKTKSRKSKLNTTKT